MNGFGVLLLVENRITRHPWNWKYSVYIGFC
jgi:hypothetical protein